MEYIESNLADTQSTSVLIDFTRQVYREVHECFQTTTGSGKDRDLR
jgi:hypothetical protein